MYTIRPDKPVNPVLLEILSTIQRVTGEIGCDYLLVGATARDILMTHVFGLDTRRATHDVDFAIALDHWERFHALKAALMATGSFVPAADKVHLLHYKPTEHGNAFPLDLIPFGAGFDLSLAGAVLLGHDTRVILHDDSLHALLAILADPRKRDRLLVHMTRSTGIEAGIADKFLSRFELGLRS